MKRNLLSIVGIFVVPFMMKAQTNLSLVELGGFIGTLNYSGDVATTLNPEAIVKEVRPMIGIHVKRFFNHHMGMGVEASYGTIFAEDVNHSNPKRGFVVQTPITQVNAFGEYNFKMFGKYLKNQKWTPFVRVGGGLLIAQPKINEDFTVSFKTYDVRPTTVQTFNLLLGAGFKFRIGYYHFLSIYGTWHHAFTDNIEGVMLQNNQSDDDVYAGLRIGYSFVLFR
ncbi:MAG: DUF6089 family protein [Bacteroidota bacterium]|nr:DUF6089 family protein [Bacteroidota bacterium]